MVSQYKLNDYYKQVIQNEQTYYCGRCSRNIDHTNYYSDADTHHNRLFCMVHECQRITYN
jgi:hypothetical protein